MITPHQMNLMTSQAVNIYRELEEEIFRIVAKRLRTKEDVDILDWQLDKMNQLHLLNKDVVVLLSKATGLATEEIRNAIVKAGYDVIEDTDVYMRKIYDRLPIPTDIDKVMEQYVKNAYKDINNYVNQTLITTSAGYGIVAQMYQDVINTTSALFLTGTFTLDEAITKTLLKWTEKGLQSTFFDKAGRRWSADSYVSMVLRTTMQHIYNDLRVSRMSEYGCYTVLVSSHLKSRVACAFCQGKVIDVRPIGENDSGYPSVYEFGYGEPGGHRGCNCRHMWFPFIPGVSENNQPQYDPEEAIKNENIEQGRKLLARRIRATKKKIIVCDELGSNRLSHYKQVLRNQQAQMSEYVKKHHLKREYGYEKVRESNKILISKGYKNVLSTTEIKRASEQYQRYVSLLGNKAPKTLDDFIQLKYNKDAEYEKLKDRAYIQRKFNDGTWLDKINIEKQARHIQSTVGEDKSFFYDNVNIDTLYDKYKMTGSIRKLRNGTKSSDEKIDLIEDNPVGIDVFTGEFVNAITIKYSKTGVHLIPTYYKRRE